MGLPANDIRGKPPEGGDRGKSPDGENRLSIVPPKEGSGGRDIEPVSGELRKIADWLSKVRFRRQWIGGLDERSVWNKIRELNALYEQALRAERIRYDVLLEEYRKGYRGREPDQCGDPGTDRTDTKQIQSHIKPAESG